MTGRGIDQILPYPCRSHIYEGYMKDAKGYVEIAEKASGKIPAKRNVGYIWGNILDELNTIAPDKRIINLETAITTSEDAWPGKGIHYRMNPKNIGEIKIAKIDLCVLSNNHILDWGYKGLSETLTTLSSSSIPYVGAGNTLSEAEAPYILEIALPSTRLKSNETKKIQKIAVFGFGTKSAGVPRQWKAEQQKAGVQLISLPSKKNIEKFEQELKRISQAVKAVRKNEEQEGYIITIASIHWGGNWGFPVEAKYTKLAHKLIDEAGFDFIHGHSSHHVKGVEVYKNKGIIYGCGDFLNDYEGIYNPAYEGYRDEVGLCYFPELDIKTGNLTRWLCTPSLVKYLRVDRADLSDAQWLRDILNREGKRFNTSAKLTKEGRILIEWK